MSEKPNPFQVRLLFDDPGKNMGEVLGISSERADFLSSYSNVVISEMVKEDGEKASIELPELFEEITAPCQNVNEVAYVINGAVRSIERAVVGGRKI